VLPAAYGYEISKLDVYQERYLVGRTSSTLLLGDLVSCSLSEVPWVPDGSEKFYFENEKVSEPVVMSRNHF
jgi:intraflagellar transport protein 172